MIFEKIISWFLNHFSLLKNKLSPMNKYKLSELLSDTFMKPVFKKKNVCKFWILPITEYYSI